MKSPQAAKDSEKLAARQATRLGCAGGWGKCRVEHVYIDGEIQRKVPDLVNDAFDIAVDSDRFDFPCAEDQESESCILLEILWSVL